MASRNIVLVVGLTSLLLGCGGGEDPSPDGTEADMGLHDSGGDATAAERDAGDSNPDDRDLGNTTPDATTDATADGGADDGGADMPAGEACPRRTAPGAGLEGERCEAPTDCVSGVCSASQDVPVVAGVCVAPPDGCRTRFIGRVVDITTRQSHASADILVIDAQSAVTDPAAAMAFASGTTNAMGTFDVTSEAEIQDASVLFALGSSATGHLTSTAIMAPDGQGLFEAANPVRDVWIVPSVALDDWSMQLGVLAAGSGTLPLGANGGAVGLVRSGDGTPFAGANVEPTDVNSGAKVFYLQPGGALSSVGPTTREGIVVIVDSAVPEEFEISDASGPIGRIGTISAAGAVNAFAFDGAVDPIVPRCAADERVLGGACMACPAGATNPAGDDPSGPDTRCEDPCTMVIGVMCEEFEAGYLKASNTEEFDEFGASVAISGDTIAIAAIGESSGSIGVNGTQTNNSRPSSGAVYVFRNVQGKWQQEAYIKASNADAFDWFGVSIDLEDDVLVVGAVREDSFATGVGGNEASNTKSNSGAVYVFRRSGATWSQEAYIKASNSGAEDGFGQRVALSGSTLAVGASGEDSAGSDPSDDSVIDAGAVYIFTETGGSWSEQAILKASNAGAGDYFGSSLALDGDTLAVGAWAEDSSSRTTPNDFSADSGAVYIFTRSGTAWSQQAYIKATKPGAGDGFGFPVALSGDTVAIGASGEASGDRGVGADETDDSAPYSGAVYVFQRNGTSWAQEAFIKSSNSDEYDFFGNAVAIQGDKLVVGAEEEDSDATGLNGDPTNANATRAGAAYLFTRSGTAWTQTAYIKASNTGASDRFGRVALDQNMLVVGAIWEDSAATGVDGDQTDNSVLSAGAAYVRQIAP